MVTEARKPDEILESYNNFDINMPLNPVEEKMFGNLVAEQEKAAEPTAVVGRLQNLEEDQFSETDGISASAAGTEYNAQYAHYLRCQAIATLVSFEEGWRAFEDLILNAYVRVRRQEADTYRGDDRDRVFSLNLRKQEAEDFVKYIRSEAAAAVNLPKPALR